MNMYFNAVKHTSTQAHKHTSTQAHKHTSTQAHKHTQPTLKAPAGKQALLLSLLLITSFFAQPIIADSAPNKSCLSVPSCHSEQKKHNGCEERYCITQKNFKHKNGSSKTFTIHKPGKYTLCENITYNPKNTKTTAIVIDADNVQLDLCGFELTQGNDVLQTTGIVVNTGHRNVTIIGNNGAIRNFSQLGLYVQGGTQDIQLGDETRLFVTDCGGKSPKALGVTGNAFTEGGIQISETNYWAAQGLQTVHGDGLVQDLLVQNVVAERNHPIGAWIGNGINFQMNDSSFSFNSDTRVIGNTYYGSNLVSTVDKSVIVFGMLNASSSVLNDLGIENWVIENCTFNENDAQGGTNPFGFCSGFFEAQLGKGITIRNSQFNNNKVRNSGDNASSSNALYGCSIAGGGCVVIEDSQACGNIAGNNAQGFHVSGLVNGITPESNLVLPTNSVSFLRCVGSGNTATFENIGGTVTPGQSQVSCGFQLVFCNGATLIDCDAIDNTFITDLLNPDPTFSAAAVGVNIAGTNPVIPLNVEIRGLHASNNTMNTTVGAAGGFGSSGVLIFGNNVQNISITDSVITQNSDFLNPSATRNDSGIALASPFPASINPLVTVSNCLISNHPRGGIVALAFPETNIQDNEISANGFGVLLIDSGCSSVLHNTFLHNRLAAVLDTMVPSTSLVAGNNAFDNGIGGSFTGNCYSVAYPFGPAPVTSSDLTVGFPPLPTVSGENIEVRGACTRTKSQADDVDVEALMQNAQKMAEAFSGLQFGL